MKKITARKVLKNYRVWLRFSDSGEGEVVFSQKPPAGVVVSAIRSGIGG